MAVRMLRPLLVLIGLPLLAGGCVMFADSTGEEASQDDPTAAALSATTTTTAPLTTAPSSTSTSTTTAPTTASTAQSTSGGSLVNDAEPDLRWDLGAIVGTSAEGEVVWLQFDRYQLGFGDVGGLDGPSLTEEPRIATASDLGWSNTNPQLRWYPVAANAEVLELSPEEFEAVCAGEANDIEYVASSLDRLLSLDARLVTLTFDDGLVTLIRDQRGC